VAGSNLGKRVRKLELGTGGGGGTPAEWSKLTPEQMEEFARTGKLPDGVDVARLFPPSYERLFRSLLDSWPTAVREEFSRSGDLPADLDPEVFAALVARRGSDR
jgi:hypothetical protein